MRVCCVRCVYNIHLRLVQTIENLGAQIFGMRQSVRYEQLESGRGIIKYGWIKYHAAHKAYLAFSFVIVKMACVCILIPISIVFTYNHMFRKLRHNHTHIHTSRPVKTICQIFHLGGVLNNEMTDIVKRMRKLNKNVNMHNLQFAFTVICNQSDFLYVDLIINGKFLNSHLQPSIGMVKKANEKKQANTVQKVERKLHANTMQILWNVEI